MSHPPVWAQLQPEGPEPRQAVGQAFLSIAEAFLGREQQLSSTLLEQSSSWLMVATPEGDTQHSNDYEMAMVSFQKGLTVKGLWLCGKSHVSSS